MSIFTYQPNGFSLLVVLSMMNLLLACVLYGCLRLVIRSIMKKMDIQLGYVLVRACVLVFLLPMIALWEVLLWRQQGYWVAIVELLGSRLHQIMMIWGMIWMAGAVVNLGYRFYIGYRVRRMVRRGSTPAAPEWRKTMEELCAERRLRVPACRERLGDQSAFLTGILRPVIYVPAGTFSELQRRVILTHELTHMQERDLLWKLLAAVSQSVFWFCPPVYRLSADVQNWSEFNCDYMSCSYMGSAKVYFDVMLGMISDGFQWKRASWITQFGGDMPEVIRRMEVMVNQKHISGVRVQWILLAIAVFLFGGSSSVYAAGYSVVGEYRDLCWEDMEIVMEVADNRISDIYVPTGEEQQTILTSGLTPEEWARITDHWMEVDPTGSGGFNWIQEPGAVYYSPQLQCAEGDRLSLGCAVEPDGLEVIGGVIGPDGQMDCIRMVRDAYYGFTVRQSGPCRFFIWNTTEETVELFGYYLIESFQ